MRTRTNQIVRVDHYLTREIAIGYDQIVLTLRYSSSYRAIGRRNKKKFFQN